MKNILIAIMLFLSPFTFAQEETELEVTTVTQSEVDYMVEMGIDCAIFYTIASVSASEKYPNSPEIFNKLVHKAAKALSIAKKWGPSDILVEGLLEHRLERLFQSSIDDITNTLTPLQAKCPIFIQQGL